MTDSQKLGLDIAILNTALGQLDNYWPDDAEVIQKWQAMSDALNDAIRSTDLTQMVKAADEAVDFMHEWAPDDEEDADWHASIAELTEFVRANQ